MKVIIVGGFLGAGKTTLLWDAAHRLARRGRTVGLVTNDQAPGLVDTAWLTASGNRVREVAGSCFCCNFKGFRDALQTLQDAGVDHVIAEPVGSCTDLSATILQPLKEHYPQWPVAPLSVLVDPSRLRAVLQESNPRLHADAAYILRLQLEEADRILLSKSDSLSDAERRELLGYLTDEFPHAPVHAVSALTGDGVDSWLDEVLSDSASGARIVEVDYDRYAHGEAVLGWLNAVLSLRWTGGLNPEWEAFLLSLFASVHEQLQENGWEVGHVKMLLDTTHGRAMANLTGLERAPQLRTEGELTPLTAVLTVNARVQASPGETESLFRTALQEASYGRVAATFDGLHCLQPGRPVPTYRYEKVVR